MNSSKLRIIAQSITNYYNQIIHEGGYDDFPKTFIDKLNPQSIQKEELLNIIEEFKDCLLELSHSQIDHMIAELERVESFIEIDKSIAKPFVEYDIWKTLNLYRNMYKSCDEFIFELTN